MIEVSVLLAPGTSAPRLAALAEQQGFAGAWILDSPAVFGDPFVSLAAVAAGTSTVRLATGVINTVTRTPIMAAAALASLNAFAPGRVVCGIGVGHTGVNALGLPSGRLADLRRYVPQLRDLLAGKEIVAEGDLHQQLLGNGPPFFDLTSPIPIHVAAAGRRSIPLAAAIADGVVLGGIADPAVIGHARGLAAAAAASAGLRFAITPSAYLSERELDFAELREVLGPKSLAPARNFAPVVAEVYGPDAPVSRDAARIRAEAYADVPLSPAGQRGRAHLDTYRSYITELTAAQRELVTDRVLAMTSLAGTPDDWLDQLRGLESAGVDEVIASPLPRYAESMIALCGRHVLPVLGQTR